MDDTGNNIVLAAKSGGGIYFPLFELDLDKLLANGFQPEFMLEWPGQIAQLYVVPSECLVATPQVSSPEQDGDPGTGGNPDLTSRIDHEKVTAFFATGQSKLTFGTTPLPESFRASVMFAGPGVESETKVLHGD